MAINGVEYAWEDIKVVHNQTSVPLEGIKGVNYTASQNKSLSYGRGSEPQSVQRGNKSYSGSLRLKQSAVEAWQNSLPIGQDLTDLRNIIVTVAYAPAGGTATTDQWVNAEITEIPKGMGQGDPEMEVELPFIMPKILYNL